MSQKSSLLVAEETVNNLKRLFHVVNKKSRSMASDAGLSGSQLWALKVLSEEPENSMTVSALARRMHLNPSTVVRMLDGLEIKGYVQRIRSINDRRIVQITISDQGMTIVRNTPDAANSLLINGLRTLSDTKLHTIASGLAQLLAIIETQRTPAKGVSYSGNNVVKSVVA